MMNWKARLRNKAFWVSAAALLALVAKTFKLFDVPDNFEVIVNLALGLLVGMGVIIDPTTPGITDK